jgi:ssDNA-binding replication factor A large subunit
MGKQNLKKKDLYLLVQDVLTCNEFDQRIKEEIKKAGGLIDEDTAALLIIDKLGRYKQPLIKIKDLSPQQDVSLFVYIIKRIDDEEFGNTTSIKYQISDDTGSCILTLWESKTKKMQGNKVLAEGTLVKIINGYVKEGFYGIEINIGKYGLLEIKPQDAPQFTLKKNITKLSGVTSGIVTLDGMIKKIEDTHAFLRENKKTGFVTRIILEDESGDRTVVLWGKRVKEIQKFQVGDRIIIEDAYIKKGEIHAGYPSRIILKNRQQSL